MSVLKIKTKKEKETFPMKKFVFNEKEFYNEIDVENAVNDYAERNVDEYIVR